MHDMHQSRCPILNWNDTCRAVIEAKPAYDGRNVLISNFSTADLVKEVTIMSSDKVKLAYHGGVPVIDFANGHTGGSQEEKQKISSQLASVCKSVGFFSSSII